MKAVLSILIVLGFSNVFAAGKSQSNGVDQVNQHFSLDETSKSGDSQYAIDGKSKLACEQKASNLGAAEYGLSTGGSSGRNVSR